MIWIEPYAGTASVWLSLLGRVSPLTAYQGGKRAMAPALLRTMGLRAGGGASGVILGDAGPWGDVWRVVSMPAGAEAVARMIDVWAVAWPAPREMWLALRERSPSAPAGSWRVEDVACYLWLQARQAAGAPVWWSAGWARGDEYGTYPIQPAGAWQRGQAGERHHQVGLSFRPVAGPSRNGHLYGVGLTAAGLSRRLRSLHRHPWPRTIAGSATAAEVLSWALPLCRPDRVVVYLDPPYVDRTGYILPADRADVLDQADRYRAAGALVGISEAVGLAGDLGAGWHQADLTGEHRGKGAEWLTLSAPPGPAQAQLSLLAAV